MTGLSDADIVGVRELIENSQLTAIECYEVSARRHDNARTGDAEEEAGQFSVEVQQRSSPEGFGIRLIGRVTMPSGEASASVAGEYALLNDCQPSQRTRQLFTNEVGVMTVFPYLREAIATTTSRVFGEPLLLPTVQRGEIAVDVDDE